MADDSGPIQPIRRAPPSGPPGPGPQSPNPRATSSGNFQALPAASAPARTTGRFSAVPAADPNATPAIAELDARIWPRVVEAFRRAEPGFLQQFMAALDSRLAEKLGPIQTQLATIDARTIDLEARQTALEVREKAVEEQARALEARAAEVAAVVEQVKLLELEMGAIKPALAGAGGQLSSPGEAFVNAVVESGKFTEILGKRFRLQTERMVAFLQQEIEKRAPKAE